MFELILGAICGFVVLGIMASIVDIFGDIGLWIFIAIIACIAVYVVRRQSREEAKQRQMEYEREVQRKQDMINQEKQLLERIRREEDIPESAAKIFIISDTKDAPRHLREIPAYLWQEGDGYKLMPVGPDQLPVHLRQKTDSIIAEAKDYFDATGLIPLIPKVTHYHGPFASEFSKVAETRIYVRGRNHPDFVSRFRKDNTNSFVQETGEDQRIREYVQTMSNQGFKLLPIIYLYGRYYFGGYEITLASAKEIREKFKMPFTAGFSSASYPHIGIHPRPYMGEIDVAKALLNDRMIGTIEYAKWKEEYLIKLGNSSDEYRSSQLLSLMSAGLLTRGEASEWMARWENS